MGASSEKPARTHNFSDTIPEYGVSGEPLEPYHRKHGGSSFGCPEWPYQTSTAFWHYFTDMATSGSGRDFASRGQRWDSRRNRRSLAKLLEWLKTVFLQLPRYGNGRDAGQFGAFFVRLRGAYIELKLLPVNNTASRFVDYGKDFRWEGERYRFALSGF